MPDFPYNDPTAGRSGGPAARAAAAAALETRMVNAEVETLVERMTMSSPSMVVGKYYVQANTGVGGTNAPGLNVLYYVPWPIVRDCTLDRIGIYIATAAGAGGVVRLGLYGSDANGQPNALIADYGTVDATVAATARSLTINQVVTKGIYHVGVVGQVNVTGLTIPMGGRSHPLIGTTNLATAVQGFHRSNLQASITGALPATPTLLDPDQGGNRDYLVALRASA